MMVNGWLYHSDGFNSSFYYLDMLVFLLFFLFVFLFFFLKEIKVHLATWFFWEIVHIRIVFSRFNIWYLSQTQYMDKLLLFLEYFGWSGWEPRVSLDVWICKWRRMNSSKSDYMGTCFHYIRLCRKWCILCFGWKQK